jgi:hypothetical protein
MLWNGSKGNTLLLIRRFLIFYVILSPLSIWKLSLSHTPADLSRVPSLKAKVNGKEDGGGGITQRRIEYGNSCIDESSPRERGSFRPPDE